MQHQLKSADLLGLIKSVFRPTADDRSLALLIDLPDDRVPDHPAWRARRAMVADWYAALCAAEAESPFERVAFVAYRNVGSNNADLPGQATVLGEGPVPSHSGELEATTQIPFTTIFDEFRILIAATELSATAPMKLNAPRHGFRAATMPGFTEAMIPALRLDYEEIHARCVALKERLDRSVAAVVELEAGGERHELHLDLRHREGTASGGLVRQPGTAGNLPSGETYIVPYEGERPDDPSRTAGTLPLELDGELLVYRLEGNRVVEVLGDGPVAGRERQAMASEPAYSNVAELGLGILAGYGVRPVGELLLDEKLGLHIAFGRSDHFGGTVGAADFTSPDRVVHIDRVYLPEVQPAIRVPRVDLLDDRGAREPLMRDGEYV